MSFSVNDSIVLKEAFAPDQIRNFDIEKLNALKENKDFQYKDNDSKYSFNIMAWLVDKISSVLEWMFGDVAVGDGKWIAAIIEYLMWAAFIFIIIYGIIKMLGIKISSFLFKPSDVKADIPYSIIDENIHELNFDDLIEKSLLEKNYRYAVRLNYLKALKVLADKDLIEWKKNKTNHDYLLEVANTPLKNDFASITKTFNYIWYGDKQINLNDYHLTNTQFSNFLNQVNYELV